MASTANYSLWDNHRYLQRYAVSSWVSILWWVKIRHLPLTWPVVVNTVLALLRSLWLYNILSTANVDIFISVLVHRAFLLAMTTSVSNRFILQRMWHKCNGGGIIWSLAICSCPVCFNCLSVDLQCWISSARLSWLSVSMLNICISRVSYCYRFVSFVQTISSVVAHVRSWTWVTCFSYSSWCLYI